MTLLVLIVVTFLVLQNLVLVILVWTIIYNLDNDVMLIPILVDVASSFIVIIHNPFSYDLVQR